MYKNISVLSDHKESMTVGDLDDLLQEGEEEVATDIDRPRRELKPQDVLQFFTGASQPPVMGFDKCIDVSFSCKSQGVHISTCFDIGTVPTALQRGKQSVCAAGERHQGWANGGQVVHDMGIWKPWLWEGLIELVSYASSQCHVNACHFAYPYRHQLQNVWNVPNFTDIVPGAQISIQYHCSGWWLSTCWATSHRVA